VKYPFIQFDLLVFMLHLEHILQVIIQISQAKYRFCFGIFQLQNMNDHKLGQGDNGEHNGPQGEVKNAERNSEHGQHEIGIDQEQTFRQEFGCKKNDGGGGQG